MSRPLSRPSATAARIQARADKGRAWQEPRPCTEPCDGDQCAAPFCGLPDDTREEA